MANPSAVAERAFDVLAEEGVEAMLTYVHPEFEMETLPGIAAEPQVYRGHDGVRRWFDSFYEVMDEVTIIPNEVTDLGNDRALIVFTMRAKGHASGLEVTQDGAAVATLRDEKLLNLAFLRPGEPLPGPPG
jgi:ketosteroid isomerase-like protein